MSISTELTALNNYIKSAYTAVDTKGGTVPQNKNMNNLSTAISSIPAGGGVGLPREVSAQGVYSMPTTSFTFSLPAGTTDIAEYCMYYAFRDCRGLTSVDMSSLTSLNNTYSLYWAFASCANLTSVNLSGLTTINGVSAMQSAFISCTGLTSIDLSSVTTINGNNALSGAFTSCQHLASINFNSLSLINGSGAFSSAFQNTAITSMSFPSLSLIPANRALGTAFSNCGNLRSVSFPALTTNSFGDVANQFNRMLTYCSNVTVHFPASIQSTIGSWSDVTSGFGGTNTTVLFDL